MQSLTYDSSILIVGGGTWGCCGALELARRGYKKITVLEEHSIPSPISAGNDLNKIMEEAQPSGKLSPQEYVWHRLAQLATEAWKTDLVYSPFYQPTGFIMCACTDDVYRNHVLGYIKGHESEFEALDSAADFRATMPKGVLTGDFPEWRGYWKKRGAGWVNAKGALTAAYHEAARLGVEFVTGSPQGAVETLLYNSSNEDVLGARTADGVEHKADYTILAAGANSDLFFDFQKQLRPTAWTLAHIPMTEEEAQVYKDLPVLYNAERGFFIEPDAVNHELKVCDEHPGYCNFVTDPKTGEKRSIPFAKQQIPVEAARRVRQFLRETMPQIAEREFSFARICWDADTPDRVFLIDRHPTYGSLIVAVGGSGMGFGLGPAAGVMIADALEGTMEERLKAALRWRPETAVNRDWWDTQDRYGADGKVMDFHDVKEWTCVGEERQSEAVHSETRTGATYSCHVM